MFQYRYYMSIQVFWKMNQFLSTKLLKFDNIFLKFNQNKNFQENRGSKVFWKFSPYSFKFYKLYKLYKLFDNSKKMEQVLNMQGCEEEEL